MNECFFAILYPALKASFDLALTDFAKCPLLCAAHKAVSHCASLSVTMKRLSIWRVPCSPHGPRYHDLIQCIVLQGLAAPSPPTPSVTVAPIKVSGLKHVPHVTQALGGSKR